MCTSIAIGTKKANQTVRTTEVVTPLFFHIITVFVIITGIVVISCCDYSTGHCIMI